MTCLNRCRFREARRQPNQKAARLPSQPASKRRRKEIADRLAQRSTCPTTCPTKPPRTFEPRLPGWRRRKSPRTFEPWPIVGEVGIKPINRPTNNQSRNPWLRSWRSLPARLPRRRNHPQEYSRRIRSQLLLRRLLNFQNLSRTSNVLVVVTR